MAASQAFQGDELDEIRSDVKVLSAPWMRSGQQPPFTIFQLVAMALILWPNPMTSEGIFMWITTMFPFYRNNTLAGTFQHLCASSSPRGAAAKVLDDLMETLMNALQNYEFGLTIYLEENAATRFTINLSAALPHLGPLIGWRGAYRSANKFRFFDLPRELRDII
jgi:hypothetical protein